MKVTVTGGAGFIGSHLTDALVARGDSVTVLDNLYRGRIENLCSVMDRIEFFDADIRDAEMLPTYFHGAEVVYHLAAQSNVLGSVDDIDYSFSTNVAGTLNVLRACVAAGVQRVVFASSREVYGEGVSLPVSEDAPLLARNPYGAGKVAAEALCRAWQDSFGLTCQVLRFTNVYGPRDHDRVVPIFLERAAEGSDLELFGGDQVIDFCWIETAVQALLAASDCQPAGPINVGSGRPTRLAMLANRVLELTGGRAQLQVLPARTIEVSRFVADITRMRTLLSVSPDQDPLMHLEEMLSEQICQLSNAQGAKTQGGTRGRS